MSGKDRDILEKFKWFGMKEHSSLFPLAYWARETFKRMYEERRMDYYHSNTFKGANPWPGDPVYTWEQAEDAYNDLVDHIAAKAWKENAPGKGTFAEFAGSWGVGRVEGKAPPVALEKFVDRLCKERSHGHGENLGNKLVPLLVHQGDWRSLIRIGFNLNVPLPVRDYAMMGIGAIMQQYHAVGKQMPKILEDAAMTAIFGYNNIFGEGRNTDMGMRFVAFYKTAYMWNALMDINRCDPDNDGVLKKAALDSCLDLLEASLKAGKVIPPAPFKEIGELFRGEQLSDRLKMELGERLLGLCSRFGLSDQMHEFSQNENVPKPLREKAELMLLDICSDAMFNGPDRSSAVMRKMDERIKGKDERRPLPGRGPHLLGPGKKPKG